MVVLEAFWLLWDMCSVYFISSHHIRYFRCWVCTNVVTITPTKTDVYLYASVCSALATVALEWDNPLGEGRDRESERCV